MSQWESMDWEWRARWIGWRGERRRKTQDARLGDARGKRRKVSKLESGNLGTTNRTNLTNLRWGVGEWMIFEEMETPRDV